MKHPFLLCLFGICASFGLFYGIVYACRPYFPDPGLRDKEFDPGIPEPTYAALIDADGKLDSSWELSNASYDGSELSLAPGARLLSPIIENIGVKMASLIGEELPFKVNAYRDGDLVEEGQIGPIGEYQSYVFGFYMTYIDQVEFLYMGEDHFRGTANLLVSGVS